MQKPPLSVFQARIAQFDSEIKSVNKKLDQIAFIRLLVFGVAAGFEIWSWYQNEWLWMPILIAGLGGFIAIIKWNETVKEQKDYFELKRTINVHEIDRLEGKINQFDGGDSFIDAGHAYSGDMDLYGAHSLFQLVNRGATRYGKECLADWMNHPAKAGDVQKRQQAAQAFAPAIDWRQELQATAMRAKDPGDSLENLRKWMQEPAFLSKKKGYTILPYTLPVLLLALVVLATIGTISWLFPAGYMILGIFINRTISKYCTEVFYQADKRAKSLKAFSRLIEQFEGTEQTSTLISELKARLATNGKPAFEEIAILSSYLTRLELRLNGLPYYIMNHLFFWDIFWIVKLEKWKLGQGEEILDWFKVLGEVEALNGIAALEFARPDWNYPALRDDAFYLEGQALGHPMIHSQERVCNPISLQDQGKIWLITGSNMSGKSTYLRTVGINIVLALMGAPVCAEKLELSYMQLASSMRTMDSIEENTSSFYAELKRLKMVIDRVEAGEPIMFLLDEILKGTNSRDRHAGARALIQQLHKFGGSGLVSTHDLELVDLEDQLKGSLQNFSFNCDVSPEGLLDFDYTLTDGVCRSMNATALMRTMGIKL